MSDPAFAEFRAGAAERRRLRAVRSLVDAPGAEIAVKVGDETLVLPASLARLLRLAAGVLEDGDAVAMVNEEAEVTPSEAAKLLGVSRQYVDRLIASGVLPSRRLPRSSYRRIPARAVLAHRTTRERKRAAINAVVDASIAARLEY